MECVYVLLVGTTCSRQCAYKTIMTGWPHHLTDNSLANSHQLITPPHGLSWENGINIVENTVGICEQQGVTLRCEPRHQLETSLSAVWLQCECNPNQLHEPNQHLMDDGCPPWAFLDTQKQYIHIFVVWRGMCGLVSPVETMPIGIGQSFML